MGIPLASSFDVNAAIPLDSRQQKADITARNAIPSTSRWMGMTVYVLADGKTYQLKGGLLDANWTDISASGTYYLHSTATGLTAFAGGGQASALQLGAEFNRVTTVATAGDSVKLPVGLAGMQLVVQNDGAATLNIFPATGEQIDALGANVAYALTTSAKNVTFNCMANGIWKAQAGGSASINVQEITTPTNPIAGFEKMYPKADGTWYTLDSNGVEIPLKMETTFKNAITNPDAARNITGWATYKDGTSVFPFDGTGGTATLTWARNTTTPIGGNIADFILSHSGVRVGEGVSTDLRPLIPAVMYQIKFDYKLLSGTYVPTFGTAYSQGIFIYDIPNNVLIPVSQEELADPSTLTGMFRGTFQTNSNSSAYRLCIHTKTSTIETFVMQFTNFEVSRPNYVSGAIVTDWSSNWTPTGAWTNNTTYTGRWRRVGGNVEIQYAIALTGAPNSAGLTLDMPPMIPAVDTAKLASASSVNPLYGVGSALDFGVTQYGVFARYTAAGKIDVVHNAIAFGTVNQASPFTFGNGDSVQVQISLPILGWGVSGQMGDGYEGRLLTGAMYKAAAQSIPNGVDTTILFDTVITDAAGSFNTSTGKWKCKSTGTFIFTPTVDFLSNGTGIREMYLNTPLGQFALDLQVASGVSISIMSGVSVPLNLKVDDEVYVSVYQSSGGPLDACSYGKMRCSFGYEKLGAVIGAIGNPTVAAIYTTNAAQSISNAGTNATILYGTKEEDTHNAYNPATGIFTAPVPGFYEFCPALEFTRASVSIANNGEYQLKLAKNGSVMCILDYRNYGGLGAGDQFGLALNGKRMIYLKAQETAQIMASTTNSGGNAVMIADHNFNYLSIRKVG